MKPLTLICKLITLCFLGSIFVLFFFLYYSQMESGVIEPDIEMDGNHIDILMEEGEE